MLTQDEFTEGLLLGRERAVKLSDEDCAQEACVAALAYGATMFPSIEAVRRYVIATATGLAYNIKVRDLAEYKVMARALRIMQPNSYRSELDINAQIDVRAAIEENCATEYRYAVWNHLMENTPIGTLVSDMQEAGDSRPRTTIYERIEHQVNLALESRRMAAYSK